MLHKKCFVILNSPPPTAECRNKINSTGSLTIGWRGDLKLAWWTVLEVLEQHAVAQALLAHPVGAAANPGVLAADRKRKRSTAFPEERVSADEQMYLPLGNAEPEISVRAALDNVCLGQPWLESRVRLVVPLLIGGTGREFTDPLEPLLRISPRISGFPGGRVYADGPEEWRARDEHVDYGNLVVRVPEDAKVAFNLAMKEASDGLAQLAREARSLAPLESLAQSLARSVAAPEMPPADAPRDVYEPVNVDEKPIWDLYTDCEADSEPDTDTSPGMPGLLSVSDTFPPAQEEEGGGWVPVAGDGGGERVSAAGGGGGTDDGQQSGTPAPSTPQERALTCNLLCGTVGRDCGLNVGGTHVGPICLKSIYFEGTWHCPEPRRLVRVVVCCGTGQVMLCPEIADGYNLCPRTQIRVAAVQIDEPWRIPDYTYSEDSDAEDNGQDRVQPATETILANCQPLCARYFYSSCKDCLIWLCEPFQLRYVLMVWKDYTDEAYADRQWHGAGERSWIREAREHREAAAARAVARDQLAVVQAFQSQAANFARDQLPIVQAFLAAPGGP
jgi:hypothetical protein